MIDRMSQDPDIRAIVLSSVGDKAFTAGLDVQVWIIAYAWNHSDRYRLHLKAGHSEKAHNRTWQEYFPK